MSGKPKLTEFWKVPVLLSSFSGLYVPGAHKLLPMSNFFDKFFKILTALALFLIFVLMFDVPLTVIENRYPKELGYFLIAGDYMVLCDFLRVTYMIIRRKKWAKINHQWDLSFKQPLFKDQQMKELNKQKQFVERIVKWEYALLVVPVMLWAIVPPIVTGKQSVESVLPWDQLKSPTFELTATYHFFYGVFMTATWSASDSWMMIYMSLIAAKLQHLQFSLTAIFSRSETTTSGTIIIGDLEITDFEQEKIANDIYDKEMNNIRKLLHLWIDHHSELISFSSRLRKFYSPIILLQYIFFVGFNCMMLFHVASGMLAPIYIIVAITFGTAHGSALYLMCWFGDRIATQNSILSQEAFYRDWLIYPKDITQSLQFIIMQSRRSVELSAFSLMPLNIKTFEQILKACYSFFMFIRDFSLES